MGLWLSTPASMCSPLSTPPSHIVRDAPQRNTSRDRGGVCRRGEAGIAQY